MFDKEVVWSMLECWLLTGLMEIVIFFISDVCVYSVCNTIITLWIFSVFSADNIKKAPRKLPRQDFSVFNQPDDDNKHILSPQLTVAAFQFLSTCKYSSISETKCNTLNTVFWYILHKVLVRMIYAEILPFHLAKCTVRHVIHIFTPIFM
jgi:hypothetical protein